MSLQTDYTTMATIIIFLQIYGDVMQQNILLTKSIIVKNSIW